MEPAKQQNQAATGLAEVLRGLSVDGGAALHDALRRHQGARAAARLACKALRQTADVGARKLKIKLTPTHRRRWEQGQPLPSLARWPRCCTVDVEAFGTSSYDSDDHEELKQEEDEEQEDVDRQDAGLLLLPFLNLRQTPTAALCITNVTLYGDDVRNAEAAVTMLPLLLSALRSVDLRGLWPPSSPTGAWCMLAALAALPQLTELHLPYNERMLKHVDMLARSSSLTRLTVHALHPLAPLALSASAAACIASLQGLRELKFDRLKVDDCSTEGLRRLLDPAPPSLTSLHVEHLWHNSQEADFTATLEQGRLVELEAARDRQYLVPHTLAWLAQVLLGCRAMPQRLRALQLGEVCLGDWHPSVPQLRPEEWDSIRALVQRSDAVHVHRLWTRENVPDTAVHRAIDALGRTDQVGLNYGIDDEDSYSSLTLAVDTRAAAAACSISPAATPVAAAHLGPLPGPGYVLRAAMRRLPPKNGRSRWTRNTPVRLLCLVGPAVEGALEDATVLRSWVQNLCAAAGSSGHSDDMVTAYQPLPPAGALVLECPSEAAAAAVATAAAGMQGVQQLEASHPLPDETKYFSTLDQVKDAVNQEIDERWPAAYVRAVSDADWLGLVAWLLRVRDMMLSVPRDVKL